MNVWVWILTYCIGIKFDVVTFFWSCLKLNWRILIKKSRNLARQVRINCKSENAICQEIKSPRSANRIPALQEPVKTVNHFLKFKLVKLKISQYFCWGNWWNWSLNAKFTIHNLKIGIVFQQKLVARRNFRNPRGGKAQTGVWIFAS